MCDINWPKSMDSGWGRKPYWSGGIAFATARDKPLRAAKCLAYSPATPEGAGPSARGERATKSIGAAAHSVRVFITPPQNLLAANVRRPSGWDSFTGEQQQPSRTNATQTEPDD